MHDLDFVLQAHFRHRSVHYDLRIQHPKYDDLFFGYTLFVDKGVLEDKNISVETVETAKDVIKDFDEYFKDINEKRMGIRKSFGSIKWLKVNGLLPKHLKDTTYNQVMLILNKGKCSIFEDRLYSTKIEFKTVQTMNNAPDLLSDKTFIFRYLTMDNMSQKRKSPFYLLAWPLRNVNYSTSEYEWLGHINDTFEVYETNAGEIMGHYLMKDSKGKWFTVDRDPTLSTKFIYVKGKYKLTEINKIDTLKLSFDVLRSNKEKDYFVGIR